MDYNWKIHTGFCAWKTEERYTEYAEQSFPTKTKYKYTSIKLSMRPESKGSELN